MVACPALAQTSTEGPLAALDVPPATPVKPSLNKTSPKKKIAHKTAKPRHTNAAAGDDFGAARPDVQPVLHAPAEGPVDPLSFGMKWNGSNDDARATRVQNYNGNATGTGAEVGMKLHF